MKHLLLTTIAAVLLVGCGESQQSATPAEATPVEPVAEVPARPSAPPVEAKPVEPVAEAASPEPPTAKAPDISIWDAAEDGNIEAVKQHLAAGTDVNAKDGWDGTPLHTAAQYGYKKISELLIEKGADVNAKNGIGVTPLHVATMLLDNFTFAPKSTEDSKKKITQLLIAKGSDVNARTNDGETSLDWAGDEPEIADLLRKHGSNHIYTDGHASYKKYRELWSSDFGLVNSAGEGEKYEGTVTQSIRTYKSAF
jgi:hypothetical protein